MVLFYHLTWCPVLLDHYRGNPMRQKRQERFWTASAGRAAANPMDGVSKKVVQRNREFVKPTIWCWLPVTRRLNALSSAKGIKAICLETPKCGLPQAKRLSNASSSILPIKRLTHASGFLYFTGCKVSFGFATKRYYVD